MSPEGSSLEKLSTLSNVKKYWHLGCLGDHYCKMNSCNFLSPFGSLLQYAFIGIKICCLIPSVTPTLSSIDFSLFYFIYLFLFFFCIYLLLHLGVYYDTFLLCITTKYLRTVQTLKYHLYIPAFFEYILVSPEKILLSSFYPLILEFFFLCRESILVGIRKCRA